VTEPILDRPRIVTSIGQSVAAGVEERDHADKKRQRHARRHARGRGGRVVESRQPPYIGSVSPFFPTRTNAASIEPSCCVDLRDDFRAELGVSLRARRQGDDRRLRIDDDGLLSALWRN
jgi:hypothetical protein